MVKLNKLALLAIALCVMCASCAPESDKPIWGTDKTESATDMPEHSGESLQDEWPQINLEFDTGYVPLPDINSNKIIEKKLEENQVENNGIILEKTMGYEAVTDTADYTILLIDENGNYITVGETAQNGGYSDICVIKYDINGEVTTRQTYGGSDFDMVHAAKYNPKMGIVISGISQSKDGDFADYTAKHNNAPFVVCIDSDTLAIRWVSPVQIADFVYCVTDDSVFVVRNESNSYDTSGAYNLSVVKLDYDGKKVWQTEPLEQWVTCIAPLADGRILVVQQFSGDKGMGNSGAMTCYGKEGEEILKFAADCYGEATPTSDGGFIVVSIRNIKTLPQPVYISSIWFDTETVATKYDKEYNVEWRKTYDSYKDALGVDKVIPQSDGSIVVGN